MVLRSVTYCQMRIEKKKLDQKDTTIFKKALELIRNQSDQDRIWDNTKAGKVIGVQKIEYQSENFVWVIFKTGKYGHTANLINRYTGGERANDKTVDEGEVELTHVCFKISPKVVYCAVEGNKEGIGIPTVVSYFDRFIEQIEDGAIIHYNYMAVGDLAEIITKSQRIIAVDLEYPLSNSKEDIFRQLHGPGVKETFIAHFSTERMQTFSKNTIRELFDNTKNKNDIRRIKITLRNEDGNEMLVDSLMEKFRDKIDVEIDNNGVIVSRDILKKLQANIVKLEGVLR